VILFPAIDLKEGLAVRLEQGDMARATVFHRDPAAQARAFEQQGFEYLHIVDLDGAFAGKPMNGAAVDRILETVSIPVQLGGGIRDTATVETWLEKGVEDRDLQIVSILKVEPALAQYGHPRFRALLRKMNLDPECEPHSRCAIDIDSSQADMSPTLHRIDG